MRFVDNRLRVLKKRALEQHMRKGNEQCRFVYRGEQSFEGNSHAVVGFNDLDFETTVTRGSLVDVHHRRKVEFRIDDLVSLWRGFQTRENERLADGNVL